MAVPEPTAPRPPRERTAAENREAKAFAIGLAMHRRGLWMKAIAHLPETSRDRKAPTLARLARTAYREASDIPEYRQRWGEPPIQPPHSKASDTWRLVPGILARLAARGVPQDLTDDHDHWTTGEPFPTGTPTGGSLTT